MYLSFTWDFVFVILILLPPRYFRAAEARARPKVTSRQVVDFDHRQPRSSCDLSEQLFGILTSFDGVHLGHGPGAEVATV